jgi:hypothetical protein
MKKKLVSVARAKGPLATSSSPRITSVAARFHRGVE